ncbi:MAG TPA: heavy metal-binding domain-containing protein [Bryobacteraceae bacterium]|nr:heavy metal-binding domain-containing protein [Bryobacteraceae bacterium]
MRCLVRRLFAAFFVAALLCAQQAIEFTCPMDRDVRSKTPGKCRRCGMTLVANLPEPLEYPVDLRVDPPRIPSAQPIRLEFRIADPETGAPVKRFEIVHEKLFHLFIVSQDLQYFAHLHPQLGGDSVFRLDTTLPRPGAYRLLADFYPTGGTPQLAPKTITTAGYTTPLESAIPRLAPDLSPKRGENLEVELKLDPPQPIAGRKTMLFVHLTPADGLELYIGAWAHLLAVSDDLVDTIHDHPFIADGGPDMQFNLFFPREAAYRVWIQFQRKGVVNTVAFTIPVTALR